MRWYLARIERYNGIYRAIEYVDGPGALKIAAREDAEARAGGSDFKPAPMWGVPIVIKANTSVEGLVTSDGWKGYRIPGHELVAPADATVVRKLKAAGAVIIGQTNMPDFAASDTNRSSAFGERKHATCDSVLVDVWRHRDGRDSQPRNARHWHRHRQLHSNAVRDERVVGVPTRGWSASPAWRSIGSTTPPIARTVTDTAIANDGRSRSSDPRTADAAGKAQPGPYLYLKADALKGKAGVRRSLCAESAALSWRISRAPPGRRAERRDECRCNRDARSVHESDEGLRAASVP